MRLVNDRRSDERADLDLRALLADPSTRVLDLVGDRAAVVEPDGSGPRLRLRGPKPSDAQGDLVLFLGRDDQGRAVLGVMQQPLDSDDAVIDPAAGQPGDVLWQGLREVGPWLPADEADTFMTAQGMAAWHRSHPHCPRCGAVTEPASAGWVRRCTAEGRELYPRTDPAVIMAVRDSDDRLLLGRSPQWPEDRRSVLAGFVEPGERLEEAVAREVAEEVGLVVDRVEYEGSQPWPFPASLMVGFAAWSRTTDIVCDPAEMAEARWYTRDDLARSVENDEILLPGRLSIARRLIEGWYGQELHVPAVDRRDASPWHRPS